MKNFKKKGFTIVELVIVIAVIAILSAVLIPTFSSLIKKANLSADQQAVRNMNSIASIGVVDGNYNNPSDVLDDLYANGFNLGKMKTYSKNFHYVYNFENKKFYLLDDMDNVIYPEDVSKDKLWGFYYNSVDDKLEGVSNYIAMDNIINTVNFKQSFENAAYNLDLNGYFIGLDNDQTNYNVTIFNGAYVSGNLQLSNDIKEYEKLTNLTSGNTYENKVITDYKGSSTTGKQLDSNINFKDCVFYNCSFMISYSMTFENCTFIGGPNNACVYIQNNITENAVIDIINCTFDGTVQRAINITGQNAYKTNIIGCVFNGTSIVEKHIIQIANPSAKVVISDCEFNALGTSPSIIRFNDGISPTADPIALVSNITFINNKISDSISEADYVDTDGQTNDNALALDEAMTEKMK